MMTLLRIFGKLLDTGVRSFDVDLQIWIKI
jgi:hypothetical protein